MMRHSSDVGYLKLLATVSIGLRAALVVYKEWLRQSALVAIMRQAIQPMIRTG